MGWGQIATAIAADLVHALELQRRAPEERERIDWPRWREDTVLEAASAMLARMDAAKGRIDAITSQAHP